MHAIVYFAAVIIGRELDGELYFTQHAAGQSVAMKIHRYPKLIA